MTEIQIICRILSAGNTSILLANGITIDFFVVYVDEIKFIIEHEKEYGKAPDKETFIAKFNDFDFIDVNEPDKYLADSLAEEYNFRTTLDTINECARLMESDSWDAVDYLRAQLPQLTKQAMPVGLDIITYADKRLKEWEELKTNPEKSLVPTGFKELDDNIGGLSRGEELCVLFARTGQGKSWVLIKMLEHMWKQNLRVGLVEPEMTANKTGYRFDTLHGNISNTSLVRGKEVNSYSQYVETLKTSKIPFYVAHPRDFKRKITVSKLKSFVQSNKLDVLAIDGISYLTDERAVRGDNRTTALTNISEDLMDLSIEFGVPVLIIAQSNREGAKQDDLELTNIRDSDGIAYNASLILSVQQKEPGLQIAVKKNRNAASGAKLSYLWDIDVGKFTFVPDENSSIEAAENVRRQYNDTGETEF